jgi:hypothetical protein
MTSVGLTRPVSYSTGMSPGMAPRTLIVCLLAVGVSIAPSAGFAEPARHALPLRSGEVQDSVTRHPVAVIDLTNDQAVRDVANRLLELLAAHPDLAPPAISDGAALVDKLPTDDDGRLDVARRKLASASKNLQQRQFREAAIDAVEGQEALLRVMPKAAIALYADLELALGQSRLGEQKEPEAREAFALTRRLDPGRTLDDRHYVPEVVQAFDAARTVNAPTGMIAVRGHGKVWIDGQEVGVAPGEFPASVGHHVVWLTGTLRETAGKEVTVTATRPGDATILDGPLTRPQKVLRLRMALLQAPDPAARASAMNELAAFINVHDAVLLLTVNGKIVGQTWRDREPGFGEIRELRRDRPGDILQPLEPPRPPEPEPQVLPLPPPPPRWYARRSVQLGVAASIAAVVIGGYLWVHRTEADRVWVIDITGFHPGGMGGGP